jgi:lysophospholipase L1-like esterase
MISQYIKFSKKPFNAFIQIIFFFLLTPLLLSFFFGNTLIEKIIYFISSILIITLLCEIVFLFLYRLFTGAHYNFLKKVEFQKLMLEPHPYLPYIYKKKHERIQPNKNKINYPLHSNIYIPHVTTNNLGHLNGENGDRDVLVPKPKNLIRINCLGASTTANYIKGTDKNYSYPLELERILKKKFNKNIEINNCAHGGYNSADLFVRYGLQNIDTKPDYVIIYHAYNDIRSYLTPGFTSDYFHSRKNLGEVYWKYYLGSKIPNIPINFINYLNNKFFFPLDERSTILEMIAKKKIDISQDHTEGLKTYERNLQHIINLSLCNNTKVILSTYCIYLYPEIKNNPLHKLYQKIVLEENEVMKTLAKKNNLVLVDAASLISKEPANFLDSVHFTSKGMGLLAECFAKEINLE